MRLKTDAVDYKYFVEPNIKPIKLDPYWVKEIQSTIPVSPDARLNKYVNDLGLSEYDANVLVTTKEMSDYFEACLVYCKEAKLVANWLMGDVSAYLNKNGIEIKDFRIEPQYLASLVTMITKNEISSKQAKQVFEFMLEGQEKDPSVIAKKQGMMQISDRNFIVDLVNQVLNENPNAIITYKQGRDNILGFLVGMTIKKSKGQVNPALASTILREEINKR
jgi:aspartyl-tRNA(Asn)/glutamyl-tRNA(Gln) amidotransferase subunit B